MRFLIGGLDFGLVLADCDFFAVELGLSVPRFEMEMGVAEVRAGGFVVAIPEGRRGGEGVSEIGRSTADTGCPTLVVLEECCDADVRDSDDRRSYVGIRLEEPLCLDLDLGVGGVVGKEGEHWGGMIEASS